MKVGVLDRNDPANVEIAGAPKAAVSPGDQAEGKSVHPDSSLQVPLDHCCLPGRSLIVFH